ncbi:MAG: hypothetical protein D3925_03525 [Candidatus Electrothrix sp. AR5]|nr:hypothetical protein [Candidatus Electrothrix sp. AR5]
MLQERTTEEYNDGIIKLANACPLYLRNPHCPLKEIRKRKLSDKVKWFDKLSLSTKKTIYCYHLQCYLKNSEREKKLTITDSGDPGRIPLDQLVETKG